MPAIFHLLICNYRKQVWGVYVEFCRTSIKVSIGYLTRLGSHQLPQVAGGIEVAVKLISLDE